MRHRRILVLGGGGFVGRHLVAALAAAGAEVTVPARRRERAKHLIVLPTVEVVEGDVADANALARWAAGHDALVNLVGVLHSRRGRPDQRGPNDYGPDFARAHVEIAQAAVSAARAAGVKRLLHMSALGAAPDAPSEYLRSKGIGEQAVLAAEDLEVTVFRPSVIFGPDDVFLNLFARLAALLPVLAVACPRARFQPVYVDDVVRALLAALDEPEAHGQRYDLGGPKVYELAELVRYVCGATGRRRLVVGLPDWASYLQAWSMEYLPVPLMTRDNYRSMQVPSVCSGSAFPFGITPTALEVAAPGWLAPARPRMRYAQLRQRAHR
ncbi:MAG: NAD-dependent dehydratase [Betaproteobacteria bacterium RIFCSPLOWO2_12_FULL_67_28]|nr:MAG: NAD-dependent dehydratase [Betaproteobacteria bacterium RIFCSPLOWO2_02_FULL_68_150]OGA56546.1 MAG: NAD-dependent dehydratase [Betaproteobacteria bacterium RIFCSPLOWO2_12_FULL_67_28]